MKITISIPDNDSPIIIDKNGETAIILNPREVRVVRDLAADVNALFDSHQRMVSRQPAKSFFECIFG